MGNVLRLLWGYCCKPKTQESESRGLSGISAAKGGVSALNRDLSHFEIISQAWKEVKAPPRTTEEASRLIIDTLERHQKADVEGLLAYYGLPLPLPQSVVEIHEPALTWPQGVKFELQILPVDAKDVVDGDGMTVYVDTADPRESSIVPTEVHEAAIERSRARATKNYTVADALKKRIADAGYRVFDGQNNDCTLARKYRIGLRGIDAPESSMPFGKEATDELVKLVQGKRLTIHVYENDQYGRSVGDVYSNGVFVQESMLKKGLAWHYVAYDRRPEFASWERQARAARVVLWASSNPEEPREWRRKHPRDQWIPHAT